MLDLPLQHDQDSAKFTLLLKDQIKRVLVTITIQQALLEVGKDALIEEVSRKLLDGHSCRMEDCYDNPSLLINILKEVFGNSYKEVIYPIRFALAEFSYDVSISKFLEKISTC